MTPAYKEWSIVCDALGDARQHVLLRKGGIAEDREGFRFKHDEFCLFPTWFHAQAEKTVPGPHAASTAPRSGEIEIRYFARAAWTGQITDWNAILRLSPYHVWTEEVLRQRFEQDGVKALHLAVVRVSRLEPGWILPDSPAWAGCRSWVELPDLPPQTRCVPVCSTLRHQKICAEIRGICKTPRRCPRNN